MVNVITKGDVIYSSADGKGKKILQTLGMLNPITAPIIIGKKLKQAKDNKQASKNADNKAPETAPPDQTQPTQPTTPAPEEPKGMSKGMKIGLIAGGVGVVVLVLVLVLKNRNTN